MCVLDPRFKLIDTMLQGGSIYILMCKELYSIQFYLSTQIILMASMHYSGCSGCSGRLDQSILDSKHYINLSHNILQSNLYIKATQGNLKMCPL